jgi:hypothetical protein
MNFPSNHHAEADFADDWADIQDPKERRRAQNRAAQRKYRARMKAEREALRRGQTTTHLQSPPPSPTQSNRNTDSESRQTWYTVQLALRELHSSSPSPCKAGTSTREQATPKATFIAPQHYLVQAGWPSRWSPYQSAQRRIEGASQCSPASTPTTWANVSIPVCV